MKNIVILHNIRSVYNIGSIFRTCDAAGVDEVWLSGYSPTPIDRFGRDRSDMAKVSLGAEKNISWKCLETIDDVFQELRSGGYYCITVEQGEDSVPYTTITLGDKNAFFFGTETTGVDQAILDECDVVAEIPMHGDKESLNVSVSAGVALFRMLDR